MSPIILIIAAVLLLTAAIITFKAYQHHKELQASTEVCSFCGKKLTAKQCHTVRDVTMHVPGDGGIALPGSGYTIEDSFCEQHCIGGCDKEKS